MFYDKLYGQGKMYTDKGGRCEMAVNVTKKKPLFGNKRSHALNATRKKQGVNLQTITLEDGTKVRLSAREIRTMRKNEKVEEENV